MRSLIINGIDLRIDDEMMTGLMQGDPDRPIGMLNQLKFCPQARYAPDSGETACSGKEAYDRYTAGIIPIIQALGGATAHLAQSLWLEDRPDEWDQVFIVRYSSVKLFIALINDPAYRRIVHHRTAALADARLLMMDFAPESGAPSLAEIVAR
jgi:uncharacterized protein (DUF1330 family)